MSQTRKPKLNEHVISCVVIQHSLHIISFPMPAMHAVGVLVSSEEMRLSFAACRCEVSFFYSKYNNWVMLRRKSGQGCAIDKKSK